MASPASNASRSLEGGSAVTGSSGPGSGSSTRPAVDVTAVTTRDDFLLELGEALGGQASVRPVDSMQAALEHLTNSKRGQVLMFDGRDAGNIREDVDLAHAQAPHAVVLIFATAEAEKQIGAAVKGSNIFAVLPIPIDKRKTAAVLEGVIADAVAKKGLARSAASDKGVSVEPFQPTSAAAAAGSGSSSGSKGKLAVWAGSGFAAVAVAAGVFWYFSKGNPAATVTVTAVPIAATAAPGKTPAATTDDSALAPKPVVETSLVKGSVDELLEKARLAMRERRYTEPTGDNALLYYRSAAAADLTNGEVIDGLQRVASVLAARFDDAMNAAHFDEAAGTLANFKAAAPKDSRIGSLELRLATAQVNKAFADGNVDRAAALVRQAQQTSTIPADQLSKWRTEITRRQEDAKLQRLAGLVGDRIRDGRLLDPADDSAKLYMQQLHDAAPTNATTQRMQRDLNASYMHKAREAGLARNSTDEDRWLSEAKAGGVSANDIASFQRDMTVARQKATAAESDRLAQLARDRLRDGKLTDPAQDSAAYYVAQLQSTDAANAAIATVSHDLAAKLVDRARLAARDGNKAAQVDADLTQAKHFGADGRDILAVQQIQNAPRAANAAATRAASPTANLNVAALAATLKRTRYSAPEYPEKALAEKLSGVVTVEFVVSANGDTRDVRVTDANPPGVFDRAAIAAIKRWHYEPLVVNGTAVDIPVRTSIRFALPK